ncbi:helix-turn-helix transcriptional regulator [Pedobacter hartonius]|uniref:DNA binding domain-containing protein, excisionase family n=1 Tax=Pedobacter hartonius TaxID=425514 RepID=A0A1H4F7F9_9SPHI|nr:helix-turn-helix domain-containing protein [Pedobacter hartonius]SEA92422.1 DNA binding domain-containing protein, excisionase family [Pedobacter hartonius]
MITNPIALDNVQILIPAKDFADVIKNIFEEVLKSQNFCPVEQMPTIEKQNDELLTRKQVASMLNISLPTLDLRIKDGTIPSYRIGKKLMFDKRATLEACKGIKTK